MAKNRKRRTYQYMYLVVNFVLFVVNISWFSPSRRFRSRRPACTV